MQKRFFLIIALLLVSVSGFAQRSRQQTDYISLINRASTPRFFLDDLVLPNEDGTSSLSILFRFDYNFLPFKKLLPEHDITGAPDNSEFYSIARLSVEIFKGRTDRGRRKVNEMEVVSRDFWADTLFAENFKQTQSNQYYASGALTTSLEPGEYNYVLQLSLSENTNERNSQRKNVHIFPWDKRRIGDVYLTQKPVQDGNKTQLPLINLGENVYFGRDFYSLIHIPGFEESRTYHLNVYRALPAKRDTSRGEIVHSQIINETDFLKGQIPVLLSNASPTLEMNPSEMGITYALVKIPNSTFENAAYIIEVTTEGQPIARRFFKSYWSNMPASLLNLDVAINHLKFLLPEKELKQMKSGSAQEKEKKFREFWAKRDPTKGTVYNELMAEYYRRIDYAFKEFGTAQNPMGQDTDQGKVYINYGPPDKKDRQFPPNGKVLEIWTYGDKKFIFENKNESGFAEFVLIGTD